MFFRAVNLSISSQVIECVRPQSPCRLHCRFLSSCAPTEERPVAEDSVVSVCLPTCAPCKAQWPRWAGSPHPHPIPMPIPWPQPSSPPHYPSLLRDVRRPSLGPANTPRPIVPCLTPEPTPPSMFDAWRTAELGTNAEASQPSAPSVSALS
eukprot:EG_transcript_30377